MGFLHQAHQLPRDDLFLGNVATEGAHSWHASKSTQPAKTSRDSHATMESLHLFVHAIHRAKTKWIGSQTKTPATKIISSLRQFETEHSRPLPLRQSKLWKLNKQNVADWQQHGRQPRQIFLVDHIPVFADDDSPLDRFGCPVSDPPVSDPRANTGDQQIVGRKWIRFGSDKSDRRDDSIRQIGPRDRSQVFARHGFDFVFFKQVDRQSSRNCKAHFVGSVRLQFCINDPDDIASLIDQRSAAVARINRRINLVRIGG